RGGNRQGRRELDPDQAEPDRHPDGDAGGYCDGGLGRLHLGDLASLRRNRGHDDRRPGGMHGGYTDQDRLAVSFRSCGQVQPVAADRKRAWRESRLRRTLRFFLVAQRMSKRLNVGVTCVIDCRNTTGESPIWSAREQALYWVDIPECRIFRWRPETGEHQSW